LSPHARRNPPPIEAAVPPYPACFGGVSRSQREAARSSSIAGGTHKPTSAWRTAETRSAKTGRRSDSRAAPRPRRKSSIRPPVASLPDLEWLDGTGQQLGAMLAAQKLQQDGDALRGGLADVEREVLAERSLHDLDPIAALEPWRLRQLDQSIALAAADRRDDSVADTFFNAALRRANNLKDVLWRVR
jgi:hypothetical protein